MQLRHSGKTIPPMTIAMDDDEKRAKMTIYLDKEIAETMEERMLQEQLARRISRKMSLNEYAAKLLTGVVEGWRKK